MNIDALAKEIRNRLHALPNQKVPALRAVRRDYSKRLTQETAANVTALGLRLLNEPGIEFRVLACELVCHHRRALASLGAKELELFADGLDNWGAVDTFACYLSGRAWREQQVPEELIHRWACSEDRWLRRAALVSTVPLNNRTQGGNGDTARTLAVCRLLVDDRDDMVVKALSWALRELAKRDSQAVRAFVTQNEKVLAARVVREVRNKLTTGRKNPRAGS
jgi:3-methyladenine DNA glycosylase AlkD